MRTAFFSAWGHTLLHSHDIPLHRPNQSFHLAKMAKTLQDLARQANMGSVDERDADCNQVQAAHSRRVRLDILKPKKMLELLQDGDAPQRLWAEGQHESKRSW